MRGINAVLSRFVLVGLLLVMFLTTGISQNHSQADVSRDLRREWVNLAQGRTDFEVSEPELLPSFLRLAAEQSGCRYREGLKVAPVRFVRIAISRLALVACWEPVHTTQRAFDLSNLQKPVVVRFPVLVYPDGIGTSDVAPGLLNWEKGSNLFQAETTSDLAYTTRLRYTYRLDGGSNFVLLRVEVQREGVGEWAPLWDAPRLSSFAKPN
jgi:hypothetical protein